MRKKLIPGLMLALAVASSGGGLQRVAAHDSLLIGVSTSECAGQAARFTVQISQGITVYSPKRLVVYGTCFTQGASITIWDYAARVSLTNGWAFVPSDASAHFSYSVRNAQCNHLLQVVVLDAAHHSRASGNGKAYGPCQPSAVLTR